MKILVTDDAAFMRMMLKNILTEAGYEIEEASNGLEAVEKCKVNDYDLVTLDITMPEMDGITALSEIKKIKPNQKCVMCSAMGQQAMVIDAIKNGAADFIVKPFQPDRVLESVQKVMTA